MVTQDRISGLMAVLESFYRTAVDAAVAALAVFVAGNGLHLFDPSWQTAAWLAVSAAVVAAIKRKVWPTSTDRAGVGRADLAPKGARDL